MMGDLLEFPEVFQEIRGTMHSGRLKFTSNMVVFKNLKTGKVEQFQSSDVESTTWMPRAYGSCLKVVLRSGYVHKFDGFKESDYDKLAAFMMKCCKKDLEKVEMSVRGWNWGNVKFVGNTMEFEVHNKQAFDIPLGNVSHTTTAKNEVTLEFHQNDDAAVSLVEMRFHIPSEQNPEGDPVEEFYDQVQQKADIIQAVGESICNISEVQCLTPRGRYDIKLYPSFLQLHGKTFDYKIPYSTVIRLFLLPHKDGRQVFFVLSVDPPIKQGQTRYHFLIILFNKDDEMNVELSLTDEELEKKYEGKLSKEMSGMEYEIVSKLMKALTGHKITVPGNFKSHTGAQSVICSYKASQGFLFPLERGFIYVHKPPVHIRFDEVSCVNFARSSGSTRSFDFDVETKAGTVYNFSSIEKDEYGRLFEFVKTKNLRVKNIGNKSTVNQMEDMLGSDDEDKHDAYLERMKQEGQEAESAGESDGSSSTDEDFVPKENESDVAEEFDSDASESGDDKEGSGDDKKEKKAKVKKTKAPKEEGSSKRQRKEKPQKDPNMPKRPLSAYFIWLNANRQKIKDENPGIGLTDIAKKGGELWAKVADKSTWEEQAGKLKKEYEVAMADYKKNAKESGNKETPAKAAAKRPKGSPKKSETTSGGSGSAFKSKEFISSSESSGNESDEPKDKKAKAPAKAKPSAKPAASVKKEKEIKTKPKKAESDHEESDAGSSASDEPPAKGKPAKGKPATAPSVKKGKDTKTKAKKDESEDEESEAGSLPSDEEILSDPTSSESSGSGSEQEDSEDEGSD